ncbi:MAG: beta-galactosidase [Planctomycetota bacterium]|nr:beta-galactosidase [Planctomycetota bacterium]
MKSQLGRGIVLAFVSLITCAAWGQSPKAQPDDNIFPPAQSARGFINFDGKGFVINGQRTFIASGSMHYARVPHELWRDRLLRIKRAGFNTVQTYAFWNFHERREGEWNFTGDADFDAFLKAIKEAGLYAVVRPGPYVCAEWDDGGYPVWLRFKPNLSVREDNPAFEAATDKWYDKIMPIIAANQINHGGAVIMVQLENEYPKAWGTTMPNGYFKNLREKALSLGIEVPYFFSGLHHANDPTAKAPWNKPWTNVSRTSPWYSTEFWAGWYDKYGPMPAKDLRRIDRTPWKIAAYGGNGWNDYMLHGGTNFDHFNNEEDTSSYDYGAAIGQAGDLRPMYYRFKRSVSFSRSFQEILENSDNASPAFEGSAAGVAVAARKGPAGTLLFLDNNGAAAVKTQVRSGADAFPASGPLTLNAGEIVPVVVDARIDAHVRLKWASRVLGIAHQGKTTTIVLYGLAGDPVEAHFAADSAWRAGTGSDLLRVSRNNPNELVLSTSVETDAKAKEINFGISGSKYRVLVLDDVTADRTWFIDGMGQPVIVGPQYVGNVSATPTGGLALDVETYPAMNGREIPTQIFREAPGSMTAASSADTHAMSAPELSNWEYRSGAAEAQPGFDDSQWLANRTPEQMGADGDDSAYAWYRTNLQVPAAGSYDLKFADAGDWVAVFVDGKFAAKSAVKRRDKKPVPVTLNIRMEEGSHLLAVLTSHVGRSKFFPYIGPLTNLDRKGLSGPVSMRRNESQRGGTSPMMQSDLEGAINDWRMRGNVTPPVENATSAWQRMPQEAVAASWMRAHFKVSPPSSAGPHPILRVTTSGLSRGFVWLNGHNLGRYPEKLKVDGIYLPECWLKDGENTITLFDEEGGSPAEVKLVVEEAASRIVEQQSIGGAAMTP